MTLWLKLVMKWAIRCSTGQFRKEEGKGRPTMVFSKFIKALEMTNA